MEAGVNLYLEVYIDVVFLINLIMDIILLLIVKTILKCSSTMLRILGGSTIGAIGACIIVIIPKLNGFIQFLIFYVILCMMMIYVAFPLPNWKVRIKAVAVLYISTFFIGGIINSLYYYSNLGYYFQELIEGNLFHNLNTKFFVFAIMIGLAAVPIFINTIFLFRRGKTEIYPLEFSFEGKSVNLTGLLDTGNSLYDPICGKPVILADYAAVEQLLPASQSKELWRMLDMTEGKTELKNFDSNDLDEDESEPLKIMMVPYHSIGKKSGLLPAITMSRVIIWKEDVPVCNEKVLTAISRNKLSSKNDYQVILHREIM